MKRRSISLPPHLETAIRKKQASLILASDKKVSFNDALVVLLTTIIALTEEMESNASQDLHCSPVESKSPGE